jgi:phosphatidylglycerol---prolipoprotein diacylglyceryl transferase
LFPVFTLGPWTIKTYSLVYAAALIIGGMFAFYRLRRETLPLHRIRRNLPLIILAGIAGAYLITIIPALVDFARTGEFFWHVHGNFFGALLAVGVATWFVIPHDIPGRWGLVMDLGGLPWPLFQAIGRIGCLGAGCCYGKPTDSWLGIYLRNVHGQWAVRYPTQIMSGIDYLIIFLTLVFVERYGLRRARRMGLAHQRIWPFDGFLFLLYFNLYCVDRFAMECLRGDAEPLVGPFSWVHLVTFAGWLTLTGLIIWNWRRVSNDKERIIS